MRKRLFIIGATGFVGSCWSLVAEREFEVVRGSLAPKAAEGAVAIDIADPQSVRAAFALARPDCVTLLAALSDIDRCQREPELAEQINVQGAIHVADECARVAARLLYTSTDAVFDGTRREYFEDDEPTPPNWYGETKARAEREIAARLPAAVIVRMSLVLGRGALPGRNSYLEKVAANLAAGNPIISPTDEFRNPIDIATLCEMLSELTASDQATGIFHIGATDRISRFDLASRIARELGFDPALVVAQREAVPGRAPRGADDFLASRRLAQFCRTPLPDCAQVVDRALAS